MDGAGNSAERSGRFSILKLFSVYINHDKLCHTCSVTNAVQCRSGWNVDTLGEEMENKLYVGNLPYATTEDELKSHFSQAGTVTSVALIKDRATGRAKGFGFVEMATADEAQKAISMFNGQNFMGRSITVNVARPPENRPRNFGDRNRGGGQNRN